MSGESATGSLWVGVTDHGLKCCPHNVVGMTINGAKSVQAELSPTGNQMKPFIVHSCPHCKTAYPYKGSKTNFSENKFTARQNDFALTTGCKCLLMCVSSRQTVRSDY